MVSSAWEPSISSSRTTCTRCATIFPLNVAYEPLITAVQTIVRTEGHSQADEELRLVRLGTFPCLSPNALFRLYSATLDEWQHPPGRARLIGCRSLSGSAAGCWPGWRCASQSGLGLGLAPAHGEIHGCSAVNGQIDIGEQVQDRQDLLVGEGDAGPGVEFLGGGRPSDRADMCKLLHVRDAITLRRRERATARLAGRARSKPSRLLLPGGGRRVRQGPCEVSFDTTIPIDQRAAPEGYANEISIRVAKPDRAAVRMVGRIAH